jgi:tetratricopeptide (TPR) repeat protein
MPGRKKKRSTSSKAGAPTAAPWPRWLVVLGLALILLTTVFIYLPAMNGARLWDDPGHITRPDLQSLAGLYRIWFDVGATQQYYPLLHTAFWVEHKLWGDAMLGYHLINVMWHLLAVVLVYAILMRLRIPGALLAAAIFAVHPVMVESVAWVTEQKNTMSAVFYLSAMLTYLKFDESRHRTHYLIAFGLFVLGLMTKTVTATLPAALLVIFWWQRGTIAWRDVGPLLLFFVLGAAAGVLTAWIERKLIGAEGAGYEMTLIERSLLAGRVVWFYLSKLFWPTNLVFIYPRWTIDPKVWWQWMFPVATLGTCWLLWALRRKTRGPLAGWLLFVGTLFPVMGFLNVFPFVFSFVADHFQYLASLGMISLAAAGIALVVARLPRALQPLGLAASVLLICTLAALSRQQAYMYTDQVTLYRTTLERNPDCWMAHNNLGELIAPVNQAEAIAHYQTALRLRPDYPEAHNNLGHELTKQNRFPEAIRHLEQSVRAKDDYYVAHNNLGIALYGVGRSSEARKEFETALKLNPKDADSHANYGNILSHSGDMESAISHYEEAVRIRPAFVAVHYRLGEVFRQRGQLPKAIDHYRAALQHQPDFVEIYVDLVPALVGVGKSTEAAVAAQKGIEIARSTHQESTAAQLEGWLNQYRTEQQRAADTTAPGQSPSAGLESKLDP